MGGPTDIIDKPTQYFQSANLLYDLLLRANDAGDFIPLWGTCLGFELLGKSCRCFFSLIPRNVCVGTRLVFLCRSVVCVYIRMSVCIHMHVCTYMCVIPSASSIAIITSQNFTLMGTTYYSSTNISLPLVWS